MKQWKHWVALTIIASLLLAACAPAAKATAVMMADEPAMDASPTAVRIDESHDDRVVDSTPTDARMDDAPADAMVDATSVGEMMDETADADGRMETPAWFDTELINAATGETFRMADFSGSGKVVLVETMAYWCSNCLQQQKEVKQLHELLGMRDDFISLGLDVDPNEDVGTLKSYLERNQFDWIYSVVPAEVSAELAALYGDQYLNPPSTPMLIIDSHGEVHLLPFGIKTAADLQAALQPYLDASM
jgi:thiol-disulfide isomerase/thioredoxin